MNLQSKTQTQSTTQSNGNWIYNLSTLETSSAYPLNQAIIDKIKEDTKNYSNDSSTFPTVQIIAKNISKREETKMNENDILKAYIEKVDRDQSDLRADIRESERRTSEKMDKIEERMDQRLNRIEDMIQKSTKDTADSIEKLNEKVESKLHWIENTCIATIIGIAAMVITVIVSVSSCGTAG